MSDATEQTAQNFSFGDPVVFAKGIPSAPRGTKAHFIEAVGEQSARVKITKRIPSPGRNGNPHYTNGAQITTLMAKLVHDDGTIEPSDAAEKINKMSGLDIWKPAYQRYQR